VIINTTYKPKREQNARRYQIGKALLAIDNNTNQLPNTKINN